MRAEGGGGKERARGRTERRAKSKGEGERRAGNRRVTGAHAAHEHKGGGVEVDGGLRDDNGWVRRRRGRRRMRERRCIDRPNATMLLLMLLWTHIGHISFVNILKTHIRLKPTRHLGSHVQL